MNIKVKRLNENAVIPSYAKEGDAGMDITATSKTTDSDGNVVYGTGLAFEIPQGYVGLLFPRSSLTKYDLTLGNHVGVLDSGYRGEVIFKFKRTELSMFSKEYKAGDRIGQIIVLPHPKVEFQEVKDLNETSRGKGSIGSSGN
jgi:dUTP pyrophosphatase